MNKNYRISGITLLPVHIGGGAEYLLDPFSYVVKDGWFYHLDMGALFSANPGFAQEFLRLSEQKFSIISLRNLVSKAFDSAQRQTWLFRSRISPEFEREYREKLKDSDNQLLVQCMLHENRRAIIPGSSIKGAFRTAVLDGRIDHEKQKQNAEELRSFPDKKRANIVEGLILSAIKEGRYGEEFCIEKDPFRGLKIGDAVLPEDCTEIIKVQNVHMNDTARTEGITMWVEAVAINTSFDFVE
jgi:CRISPR type III-A-associated RAMP protein Csm5